MSILSKIKLGENKEDFLLKLNTFLKNNNKGFCCAINANIIVECFKKYPYLEIIKKAVFNTCDGINVKRIYNLTQKSKINLYPGPDLFNDLVFKDHRYKHYFLGGKESILNGLKENILSKNIDVDEKSFYSPPFLSADSFDYVAIAALINKQNPDIIWIGLGAPKQEIFMHHLLPHINKGLMIGVGAAFNFYSGLDEYKRAPYLMKKYHLEWLFRAFQEPKRIIKRQLKNLLYLPLIIFNEFKIKK